VIEGIWLITTLIGGRNEAHVYTNDLFARIFGMLSLFGSVKASFGEVVTESALRESPKEAKVRRLCLFSVLIRLMGRWVGIRLQEKLID